MRVVCPNCETAYTIPDDRIGPNGREVRCTRCATRWHAMLARDDADADDADLFGDAPAPAAAPAMASAASPAPVEEPEGEEETWESAGEDQAGIDDIFARDASGDDDLDAVDGPEMADAATALIDDGGPIDTGALDQAARNIDADADAEDDEELAAGVAQLAARAGERIEADAKDEEPAATEAPPRKDIESIAKPKIKVAKRKPFLIMPRIKRLAWNIRAGAARMRWVVGVAIFAIALVLPPVTFLMRQQLVTAVPQLAGLFRLIGYPVNLRGISFGKIETLREMENGQPILVVEGMINNPSTRIRIVPAIRLALRGADGQEIYAWSVEPKATSVAPGDEVRFRSRLAVPPEDAVDVQLRFTERKTRQAANP